MEPLTGFALACGILQVVDFKVFMGQALAELHGDFQRGASTESYSGITVEPAARPDPSDSRASLGRYADRTEGDETDSDFAETYFKAWIRSCALGRFSFEIRH